MSFCVGFNCLRSHGFQQVTAAHLQKITLCKYKQSWTSTFLGCFQNLGLLTVPPVVKALPKENSNTHYTAASLAVNVGLQMATVMVQDTQAK